MLLLHHQSQLIKEYACMDFYAARQQPYVTTAIALALFDQLDVVDTAFMMGEWKGSGFPTQHPLDGLLEAFYWHGKRFESTEHVHPLIFKNRFGKKTSINPALTPTTLLCKQNVPKAPWMGSLFWNLLPLFATKTAKARLSLVEYRGKVSATMIYDQLPINDVFRKVDDHTVLGIMDLKGLTQPFFFVLERE